MKKTTLSLLLLLAASIHSWAVNLIVSGSWDSQMNGLYVESGTQNGKPYFVKSSGGGNYAIGYDGCCSWQIGFEMMPGNIMGDDQSSDAGNPPLTGWMQVTIAPEGKNISYKSSNFIENKINDGSVYGNVEVSYNKFGGDKFIGTNGEDFVASNKVTVTNVPAGLVAVVLKNNDSTLSLTLNGNATNQANITDLTISLNNAAFVSNDVSDVNGKTKSDIKVNFRKVITVAPTGADYTTIAAALAASAPYDFIQIAEGTYTELNLSSSNPLIIKGAGANKTIVQAAATPGTAAGRVFDLRQYVDTTELYDLTVQNGYVFEGSPFAGGIVGGYLKVENCVIKNNKCMSSSNAYNDGGGISCSGLILINSEVSGNSTEGGNSSGGGIKCSKLFCQNSTIINNTVKSKLSGNSANGGGLFTGDAEIINSTIANNTAVNTINNSNNNIKGGGLYAQGSNVKIVNSTFTGNTAYFGAGIANETTSTLINCIVYGNNGDDTKGNFTGNNNIVGSTSLTNFLSGSANVSTDPLLGSLANNGGATQTIALLANSPAINAGATGTDVPNKDQRGYFANGIRDIGAYEFGGLSCMKPVVTQEISSITVCNGTDVKFKVAATGDSLKYNWGMTDGVNWMIEPSETKDSVEFNVDAEVNGATIFTIVSNTCGKDTSMAMLYVNVVDTAVSVQNGTITANIEDQTYQWINADTKTVIENETSQDFMPNVSGNYAVVINQFFGKGNFCSDTSGARFVEVVATGLETSTVSNFTIYPNPATDNVTITLTESASGTVSIVDLHGNAIATKSISGNTSNISTAELASGVYVVKISSDKGVAVKQLIVK